MNEEELKRKGFDLPLAEGRDLWSQNRRAIVRHIANDDPKDMLNWSTVTATMFPGDSELTRICLEWLKKQPDYQNWYARGMYENPFGNPPRMASDTWTSGSMVAQAHHLCKWQTATKLNFMEFHNIFEFGGGYGAMCALMRRMGYIGNYFIYDFPELCLLQQYYLSNLGYEAMTIEMDNQMPVVMGENPDLLIACHSLSETPLWLRTEFFTRCNPKACLIAYHDGFEAYDNAHYFVKLQKQFPGYNWIMEYSGSIGYYLYGVRKGAVFYE